jgi:hypothetical protein
MSVIFRHPANRTCQGYVIYLLLGYREETDDPLFGGYCFDRWNHSTKDFGTAAISVTGLAIFFVRAPLWQFIDHTSHSSWIYFHFLAPPSSLF